MSERFWPKWELVEWSAREHSPLGEGFLVFRKLLLFACSEAVKSILVILETSFTVLLPPTESVLWVSVLAFNSEDPSSNPAEACSFFCKMFEKNENTQKRPGLVHLQKYVGQCKIVSHWFILVTTLGVCVTEIKVHEKFSNNVSTFGRQKILIKKMEITACGHVPFFSLAE